MSQRNLPFPPLPVSPKTLSVKAKTSSKGRPRRLDTEDSVVKPEEWEELYKAMGDLILDIRDDLDLMERNYQGKSKSKSEAVRLVESRVVKSKIVKASIDKDLEYRIDHARVLGMTLTRPAFVRFAVDGLIAYLESPDAALNVLRPKKVIPGEQGRKLYLKVAFAPATVERLGHHKADPRGICKLLGMTRQQVIDFALRRILER